METGPQEKCTCGTRVGTCMSKDHNEEFRVTWQDASGRLHVNGTNGVIRNESQ